MIASKVTRLKTGDILVKLVDASSPAFSHQPISTRPFSTHVNEKPGLKHWSEIPGPKNTPLIGNFLNVRHPVYDLNRQKIHLIFSYLAEKNGWDMCRVEVPGREPYIFLFCPDLTEKALRFGLYDVALFLPIPESGVIGNTGRRKQFRVIFGFQECFITVSWLLPSFHAHGLVKK